MERELLCIMVGWKNMINFCELACTVILYMYLHPKNIYFLCISERLFLHFQNLGNYLFNYFLPLDLEAFFHINVITNASM